MTLELTHFATHNFTIKPRSKVRDLLEQLGKKAVCKIMRVFYIIADQSRTHNDITNSCSYDNDVLEEFKNKNATKSN